MRRQAPRSAAGAHAAAVSSPADAAAVGPAAAAAAVVVGPAVVWRRAAPLGAARGCP